jgi:hypothetical protein
MQELISNIQISYETYKSIGKILLLLTAITGILMVKSNQRIRVVTIFVVIGSVIILNPFSVGKEIQILGENNLYRLGMILIVPILSAYGITVVVKKLTDKKQIAIAMIGTVILIAASGKFVYTLNENFNQLKNNDKVYDLAVEISDCLTKTNPSPNVIISPLQGVFIRQYNANIKLLVAPDNTENWQEAENESITKMRMMLNESTPDMEAVTGLAKELECDYLVLMDNQITIDEPEKYGFNRVDNFGVFIVYENKVGAE